MSLLDDASLLVTPNAYKEGKLYSVIPSDGSGDLSVNRATTATRVNASGLVELVPYNLFQYSEQFDNAVWSKVRFSATANTTTAPDGTLTADTISMTQEGSLYRTIYQVVSGSTLTYTASVYFKYIDRQYIQFSFDGAFSVSQRVNIDLLNGVITADSMNGGSILTSVGDGWYKLTATSTGANTQPNFYIWAIDTGTNARGVLSTGTGSTFIWGAQLVEGTEPRDYYPTETRLNIPRLDYSLGSCPNILLEPQRTNLLTYSEQFNIWNLSGGIVVSENAATSPSGTLTGSKIIPPIGTSTSFFISKPAVGNCLSIYAKAAEKTKILLYSGVAGSNAYFDLSSGQVLTTLSDVVSAKIEPIGNDGWYRCSVIWNTNSTLIRVYAADTDNNTSVTGDGTSGIYIWRTTRSG